jgi:hypothetical protein
MTILNSNTAINFLKRHPNRKAKLLAGTAIGAGIGYSLAEPAFDKIMSYLSHLG